MQALARKENEAGSSDDEKLGDDEEEGPVMDPKARLAGFLSPEGVQAALNERGLNEAGLQARPRPALAHSHYRFGRCAYTLRPETAARLESSCRVAALGDL